MDRGRFWIPVAAAVGLGCPTLAALSAERPAAPGPASDNPELRQEEMRFFETSIRPLLVEQCGKCHGPEQQRAGLRLDTAAGVRKGGNGGKTVVPGDPAHSRLLLSVRHAPGAPKMPPGGKLSDRQIADLERWVRMGAPWPETAQPARTAGKAAGSAQHWAFQPVRSPAVPPVKNRAWVKTPVDAFILASLEKKGLAPAPPADRRTLVRRATFDLLGLPPTPEEVDAFVNDRSPNAWEKVVDRLLASPHYGERWGRHWLDVARYSDTNGMDENVHYGNAWRYRDYVVASLNADKPYDRFLTEQLAGDLLEPAGDEKTRHERLVATGFYTIGPKLISEVDDTKMIMDAVDEQLDTVGRSVMALTLGCARCHDHKFDPVSTEDYYALAGIFKSSRFMTVMKKPRMWFEHSLATAEDLKRKEAHEQRVAEQKARIAAFVADATQKAKAALAPGAALPKNPESAFPPANRTELKGLRDALAALEKQAPEMPAAMGVTEGTVADVPIHIRGSYTETGKVVPRRFPIVLAGKTQPAFDTRQSGRLQLARWLTHPDHPLTGRVLVNRAWRWHFGQGIVRTTDNFGLLGEPPSHPELLDWLAVWFTGSGAAAPNAQGSTPNALSHTPTRPHPHTVVPNAQGSTPNAHQPWSLKSLHRLIMLSSTYQMSAAPDARALKVDPENRLFSRWQQRRLEAEEIRDSILAVAGVLDPSMGGRALALKNREYVFDHTSKDATKYDSKRRSLYLPVIRNNLYDVFQLFDFGDGAVPEGNRPTTTVAPQALFMMNSDLVQDSAAALAGKLLERTELDDAGRIRLLYARAYGRLPKSTELSRAEGLLTRFDRAQGAGVAAGERRRQSWAWLCHTALAANEFIYIR